MKTRNMGVAKSEKDGIVFVDDHEVMLYLFQCALSDYYEVFVTDNPDEALEILANDNVKIIVSDQAMPQITGIELLHQAMVKFPEKGRILITGNDNFSVMKEAINVAEINQFISKPWDDDNLKFAIDRVAEMTHLKSYNSYLQKELEKTVERQRSILVNQKKVIKLNQVVIKKLNGSKNIQKGMWKKGVQELTENVSKKLNISRVSVWSYDSESDSGNCDDLYCKERDLHIEGYILDKKNYGGITDVIKNQWIIQVENVRENDEARLPTTEYLDKHNIFSVLYIPFYYGRHQFGVLACEQQYEPMHWSNDEVQFLVSLTDIIKLIYRTYEKRLIEEELKTAYDELKSTHSQLLLSEKMASLGQLTAGIAHEINNPINFVYAGINALDKNIEHCLKITELYVNEHDDSEVEVRQQIEKLSQSASYSEIKEDIRSLINDIRLGATRTAEIVKGLKNFSRLDEAERKMASIHEGIESTLILLRNRYVNRIEIIKNFDKKMGMIYCYPGQLNQVLMNLLSNAIQAIVDEGVITITTFNKRDHIEIHIADSGVGVPEKIKEKIFDPFFTTKEVGEGTGLGLSISYGIVKKHKGSITLESENGQGTKFILSLPKT